MNLEGRVDLPYEVQIPPSQWSREGEEETARALNELADEIRRNPKLVRNGFVSNPRFYSNHIFQPICFGNNITQRNFKQL